MDLNYHHLRYFRRVALEGNLTRAAKTLNLSQSALSTQIKQLEARLGHDLFARVGRKLELTEAGHIALDHADRIFGTGAELMATLARKAELRPPLRVGALSTLSRNFQMSFLQPILEDGSNDIILKSGSASILYEALKSLALDVVLTTEPPHSDTFTEFKAYPIDEQRVGIYGHPSRLSYPSLAALLGAQPVILPTESSIRTGFEGLVARLGITPRIFADVDDMAMVRLLARENVGIALAPSVAVQDEVAQGILAAAPFHLSILESFYAVTVPRSFPHPLLASLLPG